MTTQPLLPRYVGRWGLPGGGGRQSPTKLTTSPKRPHPTPKPDKSRVKLLHFLESFPFRWRSVSIAFRYGHFDQHLTVEPSDSARYSGNFRRNLPLAKTPGAARAMLILIPNRYSMPS
ncbi:MAG: hypothetical protein WAV05_15690 [Anaerolineales bacterium]